MVQWSAVKTKLLWRQKTMSHFQKLPTPTFTRVANLRVSRYVDQVIRVVVWSSTYRTWLERHKWRSGAELSGAGISSHTKRCRCEYVAAKLDVRALASTNAQYIAHSTSVQAHSVYILLTIFSKLMTIIRYEYLWCEIELVDLDSHRRYSTVCCDRGGSQTFSFNTAISKQLYGVS